MQMSEVRSYPRDVGNRLPFAKSKNREKRSMRLRSVTAYAENGKLAFPFLFALMLSIGPWAWKVCHNKHVALRDLIGPRKARDSEATMHCTFR